ncbi:MAG: hypothetical protein JXA42_21130 [Anaerolineales bacterium]|nr:hypothetical protein [Anaerolineales bacterium]
MSNTQYFTHRILIPIKIATILLLGIFLSGCRSTEQAPQSSFLIVAGSSEGYTRATAPIPLDFPADHGPHPDYQTEWWYWTGNLDTPGGRHFGYQLTFFRRALAPPSLREERESIFAADQIYMAHLALSDVQSDTFQAFERFSRGAAGLAGAQAQPFTVWLENWRVETIKPGKYKLTVNQGEVSLDLTLNDLKGPILQGDKGYSQKGPEAGNGSIYTSMTRLETEGDITIGGQSFPVTGASWMDHEFSTSALSAGQVGWDWFSLQLDDNSELMLFQLRREDGSVDPYSSGAIISADGSVHPLVKDDFSIEILGTWRSPHTDAEYPAGWIVRIKSDLTLELYPFMADQELVLSYAYWEGAVRASGAYKGHSILGVGYVELTGYAASMQGQF